MVITDNQLIGNSSYSNGSTVIMERRTEQAKASAESAISEKQISYFIEKIGRWLINVVCW